jgi:lipoprotein-releasing system permease protein
MSGFETDLKSKILGQHAHIVVTSPEHAWQGWEGDVEKIRHDPGVKAASPYLESEVLVQAATNNQGVEFRGIDPKSIGGVTDLARQMEVGELSNLEHPENMRTFLPTIDPDDGKEKDKPQPSEDAPKRQPRRMPGIILGTELARNLRVYPGDDVDVACLACGIGPTGPLPNQKPFRIAGIFKTGMYEFDTKIAYTTIEDAQKFLALPGEITGVEIKTFDLNKADVVAERLRAALGKAYDVKDWRETNASLFSALKMEKIAMFIVLAFIVLVASFSIISTLIMVAVEKAREIAILKSMGASDLGVVRIFLFQGLYIGAVGLLAGMVAGLAACGLLWRFGIALDSEVYYIARLPVHIDLFEIMAIAACAVGISCLATIYPAYLAARMRPVEGLRYE